MSIAIYARIKPMTDVTGRADYISNPDRQEHLLAVAGQTDAEFWRRLSNDAQTAWRTGGGSKERKACEGREVHVALPGSVLLLDDAGKQDVADKLQQFFSDKYGVECLVGLHESKTKWNVHAHVLFPERQLLTEPVIKIADRNTFLDENGVRKRTKKEVLDDAGQLRPGCKIVPKGAVLSERYFGSKEDLFSSKAWAKTCKADLAAWINEELQPDKERVVFDRSGPYLAQIHVGKGRPKEQEARIQEHNRLVQKYNAMVRSGIESGKIEEKNALDMKTQIMLSPDRNIALKELYNKQLPRGGTRTSTGPEEALKRQLREYFKLAATARKNAREAKSEVDRKIYIAEARRCSAAIDQMKARLGYLQAEDEKERRRWEEKQKQLKYEQYWRTRTSIMYCGNHIRSLKKQRSYLFQELWDCGLFDFENRRRIEAEMESLDRQISEAEEERREARMEARMLRGELRELCAAARVARKAEMDARNAPRAPSSAKDKLWHE